MANINSLRLVAQYSLHNLLILPSSRCVKVCEISHQLLWGVRKLGNATVVNIAVPSIYHFDLELNSCNGPMHNFLPDTTRAEEFGHKLTPDILATLHPCVKTRSVG